MLYDIISSSPLKENTMKKAPKGKPFLSHQTKMGEQELKSLEKSLQTVLNLTKNLPKRIAHVTIH